jgi:hypothetical protein
MTFQPAVRENVPTLTGFAGGTGSGKTVSALRYATGLAAGKRFAVIDTENRRSRMYADAFQFDVLDLEPPFTPARYAEAVAEADTAGYPVIVIDSASHEYAGEGGILDMQDAEFERMGAREAVKMASWIKPKMAHKAYVRDLLRVPRHIVMCFRAEPKVEMVKGEKGWQVIPKPSLTGLDGWVPITEKNLPYELTLSLLLTADHPGVPKPIKLPKPLRSAVPLDKPIDEDVGKAVAAWASGAPNGKRARKDPGPEARGESAGADEAHSSASPAADSPAPDEPLFQAPPIRQEDRN